MFDHSIKVPRLYKTAAKIYQQVKEGSGSVKQLVYEKKHPNIKALYALVVETIQREEELNNLIKRSEIIKKEPRFDPWLAKILITELLFGKKRLPGESKPIKTVLAYEQIFKAHISDICLPKPCEVNRVDKPRYVRINSLSCTVHEAIEGFIEEGWTLTKYLDHKNYEGFLEKIILLNEDEFIPDIHIPNLLIFPPKTQFYRHPAYKNGSIILQDKASCLPVHILGPPPGSVVLDMCAAPGMKTTQVAAVLKDQGTVYACEKDERRFKTLEKIVESSGASCIKCFNKDILACDGELFPNVEYILVDPSCTGSGITDRLEVEDQQSQLRLNKLAGFQIKILRTALTRYPNAKRVVYSTCSIYPEENEDVVRQVLETNLNFKLVPAKQFLNDAWINFGSEEYGEMAKYCLYAKPDQDLTNGFFVAVFERLQEGEENQFFNKRVYNYKKFEQDKKRRRYDNYNSENNFNEELPYQEKNSQMGEDNVDQDTFNQVEDLTFNNVLSSKKKKRKQSLNNEYNEEVAEVINEQSNNKRKNQADENKSKSEVKQSKSKKKKHANENTVDNDYVENVKAKKSKKKKHKKENALEYVNEAKLDEDIPKPKKKKKIKEATEENSTLVTEDVIKKKSKKHKKSKHIDCP